MIIFENVHPLEGGAFRLKFRRDRRHGLKRESPFVFYPRYGFESVRKLWGYGGSTSSSRRCLMKH